ncbi:hypothetical protein Sjap_011715 [Stephania japonica]|uniref:Phosphoribosyltransferase domain-containing protein n=1 Tax=Stephania japonica TaxID=461633 RepID=A0AAP0P593_9MAGN
MKCKLIDWVVGTHIVAEGEIAINDPLHVVEGAPIWVGSYMVWVQTTIDHNALIWRTQANMRTIEQALGESIPWPKQHYAKFVKPAFDDFVLSSKKYADVIIPRGGDNHVAIDLIVQHLRTKLGLHDLCKIYPNVNVIQSTFQDQFIQELIFARNYVEYQLCEGEPLFSGESMENALRACCKGIEIGKILIHRDGDNGKQLIYEKLPKDISERHVLLLDPVLVTGKLISKSF